jgi:hypothetical protein
MKHNAADGLFTKPSVFVLSNYAFQMPNCKKIESLDGDARIVELGSNGAESLT